MYPKNAASPEPIAIGAVIQITDGAVQTSGCTVRIKPKGVAEADGAGTTSYSTDGIVYYTPTQAETDYTSFILIAKKTGCFPVSQTVVTTASSTAGTVVPAAASISNATLAADTGLKPLYSGSVTSGSSTTYVMSGVTAADDDLNGYLLRMTSGAMIGQVRMIKDWTSSGTTMLLDTAFSTALSAADTFVIEPAQANIKHVNDTVVTGSGAPNVNVVSISGDTGAADNLEAACDGTGYNLGGGAVVSASVTGSVGSLATQAKADVNAEVLDVLSTDTFAELAAIPAAASSLKDKLTWMFMWYRNRVEQTSTTKVLKADNGTTTVATFTESDDGTTYISGEGV